MEEDGITLGGEGAMTDEILVRSEIMKNSQRCSTPHERKAMKNTDSSGCSISLILGLDITTTYSDFTRLAS